MLTCSYKPVELLGYIVKNFLYISEFIIKAAVSLLSFTASSTANDLNI